MSEATVSEEQVLHNELSFEINQELIHLMKRIVEIQRVNQQLKEQVQDLKADYGTIAQIERDLYKEVIEEVREYIKYYLLDNSWFKDSQNEFKKLLQILDKAKN